MIIKKAVYKTSVVNKNNIIDDGVPEFAFVGRSNVGKLRLKVWQKPRLRRARQR